MKQITREINLKLLKDNLKRGQLTQIAKELNVSAQAVSNVLRGRNNSDRVLEKLLEVATQNAKERKAQIRAFKTACEEDV